MVLPKHGPLFLLLHFMTKATIYCHVTVILVQKVLGVSGVGIMASGAGKFLIRVEWIFDSPDGMTFTIKTCYDVRSRCFILMAVNAEVSGLHL